MRRIKGLIDAWNECGSDFHTQIVRDLILWLAFMVIVGGAVGVYILYVLVNMAMKMLQG